MWGSYNHFGVVNPIIIYVKLLLKIDELFEIWSHSHSIISVQPIVPISKQT